MIKKTVVIMINSIKPAIKSHYIKIILTVSLIVIMGLIWRTEFKNLHTGYNEVLIEAEKPDKSFVPDFQKIENIVICAENSMSFETDLHHINIEIRIYDEDGAGLLYTLPAYDQSVHINGFTSTESTHFEGLPIVLEMGHKYYFDYTATDNNDNLIPEELSFLLYGAKKSTDYLSALLVLVVTLSLIYLIWNVNYSYKVFAIIWALLMVISLFFMPVTLSCDSDEKAYLADCYKQSSELLKLVATDSENNIYIKEFGIRNIGFVSYSVPLYRFWMDTEYGNSIADYKTSNLYKNHNNTFHLAQMPAVIMVSVARMMKCSYRMVLLSGWIINAFIAVVIAFTALKKVKNNSIRTIFYMVLLLPSTMSNFYSYSCKGIILSFCMLAVAIMLSWELTNKCGLKFVRALCIAVFGVLSAAINMNFSLIMNNGRSSLFSVIGRFDDLVYSSVINYVFYNEYFIVPIYMYLVLIIYCMIRKIKCLNADSDSKCDYYMLTYCSVLAITIWMHHLMSL